MPVPHVNMHVYMPILLVCVTKYCPQATKYEAEDENAGGSNTHGATKEAPTHGSLKKLQRNLLKLAPKAWGDTKIRHM